MQSKKGMILQRWPASVGILILAAPGPVYTLQVHAVAGTAAAV